MAGFGITPFGTLTAFGGAGLITLITVLPLRTNELVAFFDRPPRARDYLGFFDATNVLKWRITAVDPRVALEDGTVLTPPGAVVPTREVMFGQAFADEDDPTQVHLRTVPELEPGVDYEVALVGAIKGKACELFAGPSSFRVWSIESPPPLEPRYPAGSVRYTDWANPWQVIDGELSTGAIQYTEAGDIARDTPLESLRKRVYRRFLTVVGSFSHVPDYGLPSFVKRQVKPDLLGTIASRLQEQLLEEPDVQQASVVTRLELGSSSAVIYVDTTIVRRGDQVTFSFQLPTTS